MDIMYSKFKEWFEKAFDEMIDKAQDDKPVMQDSDPIGLCDVAVFFSDVSAAICAVEDELEDHDYKLSPCTAYETLAALITKAGEYGWVDQAAWEETVKILFDRSVEFVGDQGESVGVVSQDPELWAMLLNLFQRYWYLERTSFASAPSAHPDDMPVWDQLHKLRSIVIFARNYEIIDGGWVNTLINDLKTLYDIHKPDPGGTGGTFPWSHSDGRR